MPLRREGRGVGLRHVREMVQRWQGRLRLADWDVEVQEGTGPDRVDARVEYFLGEKVATIICTELLWGKSRREQRRVTLHEMLHLVRGEVGCDIVDEDDPRHQQEEVVLDRLAKVLEGLDGECSC